MGAKPKRAVLIGFIGISISVFVLIFIRKNNDHRDVAAQKYEAPPNAPQIGNRVRLYEGYDSDPLYLRNPPASERQGIVRGYIQSQNNEPAIVVELDSSIIGEKVRGKYCVLELRNAGQTWSDDWKPVHIELCDFYPDNKIWKYRRQGELIESAALFEVIKK